MSYFWETMRGQQLAETIVEEMPRIRNKLDILIQEKLEHKKPTNQTAVYIAKDELQEYVDSQIKKGYCLVSIVPGIRETDDVLVVMNF